MTLEAYALREQGVKTYALTTARKFIDENGLEYMRDYDRVLSQRIVYCIKNLETEGSTRKYNNIKLTSQACRSWDFEAVIFFFG